MMTQKSTENSPIVPLFSFRRFLDACSGIGNKERSDLVLKSALILHDKITTFGPPNYNRMLIDGICLNSSVRRKVAEKAILELGDHNLDIVEDVEPRWVIACLESWSNHPELGFRHDRLQKKISELREGQPMEVYDTPLLGLFMSTKFGFSYHTDSEEFLEMTEYWRDINTSSLTATKEMEITLPPISELTLDAIFELRLSPYINNYREFVYRAKKSDTGSQELREKIEDAIWSIIGSNKPRASGSVLSRTLAAAPVPVPIPLPNPFGVYKEIKEGKKERKLFNDYGWIWFINEVREHGAKSREAK